MAEQPVFRLGIIGGCLSHQPGIPMSALYHRQLADMVAAGASIRLRPHIARAFGHQHAERLDTLLARHQVDGVLLHLRVTVKQRSRLVVRQVVDGRRRRVLHPALLRRRHDGEQVAALRALERAGADAMARPGRNLARRAITHDRPRSRRSLLRGPMRGANSALGVLFGLDRWAVDDEMLMLGDCVRACAARNVPLFVLGPTPLIGRFWEGRAPRMLNARIRQFARETGLPVAVIDAAHDVNGRLLVKRDGLHLTPEGHRFVAATLYRQGIGEWMASIVAGRRSSAPVALAAVLQDA